jgi:hypothetical protein
MPGVTPIRKLVASLATIAAATGLMAFGTFGVFEETRDHFPQSVSVRGGR